MIVRLLPVFALALLLVAPSASAKPAAAKAPSTARIVSLGGALTEIVYALGFGDRVVGVDAGSTYPAAAASLPRTGHAREIAVEGVVALRPTLVFASDETGPPSALARLEQTVPIVVVPSAHSLEAATSRVRTIGQALGVPARADSLADAMTRAARSARPQATAAGAVAPRVLFVYARGAGTVNVAGDSTAADAIIELAGGVNAVAAFEGYRPLTAEGVLAAKPDVIVTPTSSAESLGGVEALLALPGVGMTPAGKAKRVVTFDTLYLLGFGPRVGDAARDLARAIAPGTRP